MKLGSAGFAIEPPWLGDDAEYECHQRKWVATVQRQVFDLATLHDLAERRGLRQRWRFTGKERDAESRVEDVNTYAAPATAAAFSAAREAPLDQRDSAAESADRSMGLVR